MNALPSNIERDLECVRSATDRIAEQLQLQHRDDTRLDRIIACQRGLETMIYELAAALGFDPESDYVLDTFVAPFYNQWLTDDDRQLFGNTSPDPDYWTRDRARRIVQAAMEDE